MPIISYISDYYIAHLIIISLGYVIAFYHHYQRYYDDYDYYQP